MGGEAILKVRMGDLKEQAYGEYNTGIYQLSDESQKCIGKHNYVISAGFKEAERF